MTKLERDIKALDECIARWRRMRKDRECGEEPVISACALCELYWPCDECPIPADTGRHLCYGTPYGDANRAFEKKSEATWQAAATAEINYLVRLRRKLKARLKKGKK